VRLFAIGDTHLPSTRERSMERFGWIGHPGVLAERWDRAVDADDVVLVVGDISWATKAEEAAPDLEWLDARRGRKVLLRGNHDNWWGDSRTKLRRMLAPYASIAGFVHGSAVLVGPWLVAGSRLWDTPDAPLAPGEAPRGDLTKQIERELGRLRGSFEDAERLSPDHPRERRVAVAHYPPRYRGHEGSRFSEAIEAWGPRWCVYGHLHGPSLPWGFVGDAGGVRYTLVSCDAAGFCPVVIDAAP
jgi:hypothetical protein